MEKSRRFWFEVSFLYMLVILWSSMVSSGSSPTEGFSTRGCVMNFLHIPAYSLLAYFFLRTAFSVCAASTPGSGDFIPGRTTFIISALVFTAAVCFGVFNEFVQAHVPGREFSIGDMLRNALGAGLTLVIHLRRRRRICPQG